MLLFAVETTALDAVKVLFESNVPNWVLLLIGLAWLWNKVTPQLFESRKERIESSLREAGQARAQGEAFFKEQQARVANAEQEAAKILEEARALAAQLKQQMEEQTAKDLADLKAKIESQMATERQLAITELRTAAAKASIALTEQMLPSLVNDQVKSKLLSQFLEQLDGGNASGPAPPRAGSLGTIR